jgi:CRP-like cAMP-binding protein
MDTQLLSQFVPFNALSQPVLNELADNAEEITLGKGRVIFHQGDDDPWLYFLLEGEVICQERGHAPRIVESGSEDARFALARTRPRGYSTVAATPVRLVRINEALLEARLGFDQAAAYEIFEYNGSADPAWMLKILAEPAFRNVPSAHANAMFERFQPRPCKRGDVIIQQGELAEYYYLIRAGHAEVSRAEPGGPPMVLAELGPGDGFGEEALLTGERRNATVTMLGDGLLMRLSREDFNALLKAPLVKSVDLDGARRLLAAGAQLVDVRLEEEFRAGSLSGSLNLPLFLLRLKVRSLDPQKKYILFCQHDQRSSAAAFLFAQRGLDAYVLRGGLAGFSPGEDKAHLNPLADPLPGESADHGDQS